MCYHDVDVDVLAAGELHPHPSGHHARRGVLFLHDCVVTLDGFRSWVTSLVHSPIRAQDILGSYTDL